MISPALALLLPALVQGQTQTAPWLEVVSKTAPSVVSIRSRIRIPVGRDEAGPFEGSGFVVDFERGLVATNRHVAGEGVVLDLEVRFHDGTVVPAERVFSDPLHDFAFLRFDPKKAPAGVASLPLVLREAQIGEEVRMIGNNGGLAATLLGGTIANLDASWDQDPGVNYLQTSIASAGGSSGSPVVDGRGHVLGMQAAHDDHTSYALPSEYLWQALKHLSVGATPPRGSVGLRLRKSDPTEAVASGAVGGELARQLHWTLPEADPNDGPKIAIVEGVVPDSPCEGLAVAGEVVLTVAGVPAGDLRAVELALDQNVGKPVDVSMAREGKLVSFKATVADLNQDIVDRLVLFGGAAFQDVNYEFRSRSEIRKSGVAVAHVEAGSAAEAADLRRDDVVTSVAGKAVADAAAFWRAVSAVKEGDRLLMVIRRPSSFDSATRTVSLVTDRTWDPSRFLKRNRSGWVDVPAPKTKPESAASRPATPSKI